MTIARTRQEGKGTRMNGKQAGPVGNLEELVKPDWWKELFDEFYLKTDGDVVEDTRITSNEVDTILEILDMGAGDAVLDLCCGQGRHVLELASRGFKNLHGLDQSTYLIQEARNRAKKVNAHAKFKRGDARKLPYGDDFFDAVLVLGNSFGYFQDANDDVVVLKEINRVLKPGGILFLDLADGEYLKSHYQEHTWEWVDKKLFVVRERKLTADGRMVSREIINHVKKGVLKDRYYSERLYDRKQLAQLLGNAGFLQVKFHGTCQGCSTRNQDLGMMERRYLVSGVSNGINHVAKSVEVAIDAPSEVVVILGDPRLSDRVKPGCTFDEDDFETIRLLRKSLEQLDGFSFSFVSNHAGLLDELLDRKAGIDLVFNLCDEGYYNDPRKELHVPALLEILDIPYTGGAPQNLALCYDKGLVRCIAKDMGVPVPAGVLVQPGESIDGLDEFVTYPAIVKPNFGDSSFGITKNSIAGSKGEVLAVIEQLRDVIGPDRPVLVEQFLPGADLSLGIIGNPETGMRVLPIIEEDYSNLPPSLPRLCGYEAKWDPSSPYWQITSREAHLARETRLLMVDASTKLFSRLECRDYARFDWRLDENGIPRLLEVNPNPGWCWDGHLAKMAKFAGLDYPRMIGEILKASTTRIERDFSHV